jgi:hypothetical protein
LPPADVPRQVERFDYPDLKPALPFTGSPFQSRSGGDAV